MDRKLGGERKLSQSQFEANVRKIEQARAPEPPTYKWTFEGTAADNQTWTTTGTLDVPLLEVTELAFQASFVQLTKGKATYGQPGLTCNGPYKITKLVIERVA